MKEDIIDEEDLVKIKETEDNIESQKVFSPAQSRLFSTISNFSVSQIFELINLTVKCEQYEDLLTCYESLFKIYPNYCLNLTQVAPIEIGIKGLISKKQQKLQKLENLVKYSKQKEFNDSNENISFIKAIISQQKKLETEMNLCCKQIIKLFDNFILKNLYSSGKNIDREVEVFCFRIKGDLYKYLSFIEKKENEKIQKNSKAKSYYVDAFQYSKDYLEPSSISYINSFETYAKYVGLYEGNSLEAKIVLKDLLEKLNTKLDLDKRTKLFDKISELTEMYNIFNKNK